MGLFQQEMYAFWTTFWVLTFVCMPAVFMKGILTWGVRSIVVIIYIPYCFQAYAAW